MSYFQRHIFFCTNQRDTGEASCCDKNASELQNHAKQRAKSLNLMGPGKCRINKAGCLDRCEEGPVCVVYPEAVWYTYVDKADVDEIIERHVARGEIVERLKI